LVVLRSIGRKRAIGGWLLFFFGEVYLAVVVGAIASLTVDQLHFPGTLVGNPGRRLSCWLGYFSVSVRVRMVFFSKTWGACFR
jgi:hypothetical protein